MKNKKIKSLSLALIGGLLSTNLLAFGNTITTSELTNYVGTGSIGNIIQDYEYRLKKLNNTGALTKLYNEKANLKINKLSDNIKQEIITSSLNNARKNSLKIGVAATDTKVLNTLVNSMKNTKKSSYNFYVKTSLSQDELKQTITYFDNAEISLEGKNSDGTFTYKVILPYAGKYGKILANFIENGNVPETLLPGIEIIKPFVVKLNADTNYLTGESLTLNWGISKIGAQDYQKTLKSKTKLKVGVIDTGVSYTHSDLAGNLYTNTGETAGNGIDDDGNGYIDDVNGWNFVAGTNASNDDHGHGSHVSGIIGATVNGKGIFGVNSNVSLVPLKVLDSAGYGSSYGIVEALNYAANNGVKLVNLSLGGDGTPTNDIMCTTISQIKTKGVTTIVAAGNENSSVSYKVPAGCSDAITVGAVDSNNSKASFSNYGTEVDVSAPGVNIYSTVLNNSYASWNGTSMATPFVTGLVASMLQINLNLDYTAIKNYLTSTATNVTSSVNIGKLINMTNIMTSLGVSPDSTSTGSTNIAPTVTLNSVKNATNNYNITATGSDSDGSVKSVVIYKDGVAVSTSGTYNAIIKSNTTIKAIVTDNLGATAEKSITLTYEAPVTNLAPTVTFTTGAYTKTLNYVNIAVSDSDGKIAKEVIYVNGKVYYTYSPNIAKTSIKYYYKKGVSTLVKVIVTDDKGAITEKSITVK